MSAHPRLAVTFAEAAEMCAVSIDTIRRAVRTGDLPATYPTARPVVLVDDLRTWLDAAPKQPRSA